MGQYGISPERFQENQNLSSFFKVLTTSTDEDNKVLNVYVSTVHSHNYPMTAFQWHPEKNAFEWGLSMIPHSEEAVQVTQHVANFLVSLLSSGSSSSFFPLSHSLPLHHLDHMILSILERELKVKDPYRIGRSSLLSWMPKIISTLHIGGDVQLYPQFSQIQRDGLLLESKLPKHKIWSVLRPMRFALDSRMEKQR
ncbi:putative gamma-glutamyl hydrolase 3 [Quercus suber]|uniref:Gamma-glutamyl hydrolase 3 n=1 Tax=Quercus suber TaxID=58331 RepID=A0AAW0LB07_QUESU